MNDWTEEQCRAAGGHRVELHGRDRPPVLFCRRCGLAYVRDESKRRGYRVSREDVRAA